MNKAQLLTKCPWLNPNGWYATEAIRAFNRENKTPQAKIEEQELLYIQFWEKKTGKLWRDRPQGDQITKAPPSTAPFKFENVRPKYFRTLIKKLNKAKMPWVITATSTIGGAQCVSGYAHRRAA